VSKVFKDKQLSDMQSKYSVNETIKSDTIMVIGLEGENHGTLSRREAIQLAESKGSDLVQVGEKDGMVIAKIMDYGKFLYAKKKQLHDAKKNQKVVQIKEIKIRPNIGDQDYKTKLNHAVEFFNDGKKVKFTLQFKGREVIMMNDLGKRFFERIELDLAAHNIDSLVAEKESKSHSLWSKIYFVREK
jgi:translation initiation factor IF-3